MLLIVIVLSLLASLAPRRVEANAETFAPKPFGLTTKPHLSLGFGAQIQGSVLVHDADDGRERGIELHFRRLRSKLKAQLLERRLEFVAQLNLVPGSMELIDLYASYRFSKGLQLRIGQVKVPLTRYRWQSFSVLPLVDWAITTRYFGAERQLGVLLLNDTRPRRLNYVVGLYHGTAGRSSHASGLAETYGERQGNPSSLSAPAPLGEPHPELGAGLWYHFGALGQARPRWRLGLGLSGVVDTRPVVAHDLAGRLAAELTLEVRDLSLSAIGYYGVIEDRAGSLKPGLWGVLAEGSYRLGRHLQLGLRYALVGLLDALQRDAAAWREQQVAALGPTETLNERYLFVGQGRGNSELGFALNVPIVGHSLKWQNDFRWLHSFREGADPDEFVVRTQLQLVL